MLLNTGICTAAGGHKLFGEDMCALVQLFHHKFLNKVPSPLLHIALTVFAIIIIIFFITYSCEVYSARFIIYEIDWCFVGAFFFYFGHLSVVHFKEQDLFRTKLKSLYSHV